MSVQLTESQRSVVENEGGSLLVSAAAGSGKTRVLVDRLFRRVLGPEQADVDDFLIITYTRAAAAELRGRIAQELAERLAEDPGNRHLQRQLLLVYQADIKTIDAFCTALLRENVHLLRPEEDKRLTADFRVLDEAEADLMRGRVLPRVLEEFYSNLTEEGARLADSFGFGRDDRGLEELVLDLYNKIQSHAYPERWLRAQRESWENVPTDAGRTVYGQQLLLTLGRKARHWAKLLRESIALMAGDQGLAKAYGPAFAQGAALLEELAGACEAGWDEARAVPLVWPKLSAARKCEDAELKTMLQSRWNRCKKEMDAAWAVLDASAAEAAEDLRCAAPAMRELLALCADFSEAYRREKLRRNATDFSDQEHYAVELLLDEDGNPTELAETVSSRYLEVMVDEYQDTNQVQNCIFTAISRNGQNLFTVGDVKQSIYRFRLADPTIFLEKYLAYPHAGEEAEGQPRKILLSQNFRSRREVLDATNFVFQNIMSREMGEMDYGEEERLNFGADYLPPREDCAAEFHLLDLPTAVEDGVSRALLEARLTAARVKALLDGGYPVTDSETGALRPCRAEDIVILMRSPGPRLRHYARALGEVGIPCSAQEDEDFFASMEVAVAYALLQILDNPRQDVPLISVLRSPLVGFSPDRLALIRGAHPGGDFYEALSACKDPDCVEFLDTLGRLRLRSRDMSVHRLIWHLYNELNVLGVFGAMAGGDKRRENLIALYEYARGFESAGYKGLFAFVSHLRFLLENGEQPMAAAGSAGGGVRIMSIHKSKGLEFPIVILADLNKSFNRTDLQTPVLVHPKLGLGPMYIDLDRRIRYPTVARQAISAALSREMRSEEMRVLYVGMTRAKEKLIMVASMPSAGKKLAELAALSALPVPPETVDGAKSMAEWILLPLLQRREAAPLRSAAGLAEGVCVPTEDAAWEVFLHDGLDYVRPPHLSETGGEGEDGPRRELPFESAALEYHYPYAAACLTPTKLTATQLKGREKDREIAEKAPQPYVRRAFARPRFLKEDKGLTADQRGTATHLVMQYLPLEGDPAAVIADLVNRRLLTEEQARAVRVEDIRRFLASPLADELRKAKRVEREFRFSLLRPASDYYPDMAAGDTLLLQGVVDLFAETEEGIIVVDFKTDYVTPETVLNRAEQYRPQIGAYSAALERIMGRPVVKRCLYFFRLGETVEV